MKIEESIKHLRTKLDELNQSISVESAQRDVHLSEIYNIDSNLNQYRKEATRIEKEIDKLYGFKVF